MSLDKLKKWNSGIKYNTEPEFKPVNTGVEKQSNKELMLIGKIGLLEQEISSLRYDILTILDVIGEEFPKKEMKEIRASYYRFRADPDHLMNRITDKINNDLTIKNDQGEE